MVCLVGGYKTLSPVELSNVLGAYDEGRISFRALRTFFAAVAVIAAKEAAARSSGEMRRREKGFQVARPEEVSKLTRTAASVASEDLRRLERFGLLEREGEGVKIASHLLSFGSELIERASCGRSFRRPVPIPRSFFRFLARCSKPALAKVLLAHCVRGLTLDRRTGEVRSRGTVKASWIAEAFGVSLRAAKAGRATLIAMGLLSRDTGSMQRKLNAHGAYFELNLAWRPAESAPRTPVSRPESAPPRERLETPSRDLEDQRTQKAGLEERATLKNVFPEDLRRLPRMEELFWGAVHRGLLQGTEMDALNFLAASVRARAARQGDAVRIFVGILRRRLWKHITFAEEEHARRALARYREKHPEAFRRRVVEGHQAGSAEVDDTFLRSVLSLAYPPSRGSSSETLSEGHMVRLRRAA